MTLPAQPAYRVEPLADSHDRASFTCGDLALDRYFTGDPIRQDISRKVTNAFVLTPDGHFVAGFYTLSTLSILTADLPAALARKLPTRPIGVTLLGRMARVLSLRGQHIGELLLADALHRSWLASRLVSSFAVVVDAKPGARDFYLRNEFIPLPTQPNRLFLPMKTLDKLFSPPA